MYTLLTCFSLQHDDLPFIYFSFLHWFSFHAGEVLQKVMSPPAGLKLQLHTGQASNT